MTKASTFSDIIGKREVYGSGIFCGQILNGTTILQFCVWIIIQQCWAGTLPLGPTKSLTNVAQNLAQLIVNSMYLGTQVQVCLGVLE